MQTLSVCMIVKNEQEFITECLQSVHSIADEIIVVDTGCTDQTIEIVKRFEANVFPFKWIDDFSAARNESIKHAKSDWILWLDADERLRPESVKALKQLLKKEKKPTAYVLPIWNMMADKKNYKISGAHRLFTNHKGLYFTGRIHEQIVHSLAEKGGEERECAVTLIHLGYGLDETAQQQKNIRNRILLERMVKEEPENAYAHYTLAQNYSQTFEWQKAARHYEKALKHQRFDPGMEASLLNTYAEALMKLGQMEQAGEIALQSVSKIPQQVGGYYLLYKLAESGKNKKEALDWLLKLFEANVKLRTMPKKLSTDILLDEADLIYELFKNYAELNEPQQALEWFKKLPVEKRVEPDLLINTARQFLQLNDLKNVLECLQYPVLAEHPAALDLLGIVHIKQQDWQKASEVYEKLLAQAPHDAAIVKRLAGIYAKNGQMQKAQTLIEYLNQIPQNV